ncbi:TetR/AcrR family transcriptional regulator [Paenibacillus peoriae]|uniref:TetR/AcrR family transcriptional regulator n=1 Tax=Paenibacillus peoriae TaxID=59893 RepID=UPI00026C5D42|nr:TetR/AcrR family transcriptional regulator [Paenibacillus peoriae]MEC0181061.1 TetR/AcrR family transcriptional regulator [Paenibacillus peoriae]
MGKDKVDLRILKTRKAIKEAFLTLIQTKGYERITVQDIADEAMINRNTFYLHYVDKPDLMEKLCQESVEKLNVCPSPDVKDIHEIDEAMITSSLREIFYIIEGDIAFFKTMLSHNGQPNFTFHLKEALKKTILFDISDPHHDRKMKVALEYMISGLVGVICLWITDHENLGVEEIIEHLSEIHFNSVLDLFKNI